MKNKTNHFYLDSKIENVINEMINWKSNLLNIFQ